MKRSLIALLAAVSFLFQGGCAVVLLGTGAVAGYSLSKDSIEGYTDHKYDKVWNKCIDVMREKGALTLDDKEHGRFEGTVREVSIKGQLTRVSDKTVKLRISGRKALIPKVDVAQEIYTKVIDELAKGK